MPSYTKTSIQQTGTDRRGQPTFGPVTSTIRYKKNNSRSRRRRNAQNSGFKGRKALTILGLG